MTNGTNWDALRKGRYHMPSFSIQESPAILNEDAGQALDFDVLRVLETSMPEIEIAACCLCPVTEEETRQS
ncbi:MAG: hypothetical protein CL878_07765 [Dehalococcoidia bacterium]|nr:hypothetical protein [Dehalococcoidia bacterium]